MYGLKNDWLYEPSPRAFVLEDYSGAVPRWCPGCGDHAVLTAVQKLCRDEQLKPEETVFVSGIGCSSRFPHYMKTYGFHGLHGRALPIACGVRSRRPDLNVFVSTGDGDCFSIGTAHWIHALRYNMKMVVMIFDNNIYGLTKKQTSPTTAKGKHSNTHPKGTFLSPLNPITVTLGVGNASFVAQTVDWSPPHLYATLKKAFHHPGLSFVRIMQRCPHFTAEVFKPFIEDPTQVLLMTHENGIQVEGAVSRVFSNQIVHDPSDLNQAHNIATNLDHLPIGLFYQNTEAERYDQYTINGLGFSDDQKLAGLQSELNRFSI
ncbi:MAG: 2-oxoglutarate oxidoreductase [Acidobacteria bacterium]|nr:2-oxoglutarate oxidoreductase [Acidobacteriota bacterium]MCB9398023.1 2-oxoglutarate oxidoreductase [Acidobacteriota bacterium]